MYMTIALQLEWSSWSFTHLLRVSPFQDAFLFSSLPLISYCRNLVQGKPPCGCMSPLFQCRYSFSLETFSLCLNLLTPLHGISLASIFSSTCHANCPSKLPKTT